MSNSKPADSAAALEKQPRLPAAVKIMSLILKHLAEGELHLELPDGRRLKFGTASIDGPAVLEVHDMKLFRRLMRNGSMRSEERRVGKECRLAVSPAA